MPHDALPPGSHLVDRDDLPPSCALVRRRDGEIDILDGSMVRATIRFDIDVETWALFVHDRPFPVAAEERPHGRREVAASDPERLLALYLVSSAYAAAA